MKRVIKEMEEVLYMTRNKMGFLEIYNERPRQNLTTGEWEGNLLAQCEPRDDHKEIERKMLYRMDVSLKLEKYYEESV